MAIQNHKREVRSPRQGLPRGFDVLVSLMLLVLSAPLLLVAAVMVLLTSSGGFLFKQKRVGRYGELFVLYKLRTMTAANTGPQVTCSDDARITRVGRFLRKTKVDELPTLWNVLKGDIALVGPRPEVPRYVNLDDPQWRLVLMARPGITDPVTLKLRNEEELLAQVRGDAETYYVKELLPLKLKGYIAYTEQRHWRADLWVLWKTLGAIAFTRSSSTNPPDWR